MRKCLRTIDKPLLLFGLEPEDVGILALACGSMILFFDTFYAGLVFFGGVGVFKADKTGQASRVYYALVLQTWDKDKGFD